MSSSFAEQDRKDLRRAQADLEECRAKIKELRGAKSKAAEMLKRVTRCCALNLEDQEPSDLELMNEIEVLIVELEEVR